MSRMMKKKWERQAKERVSKKVDTRSLSEVSKADNKPITTDNTNHSYTKTDIARMNKADLVELASKLGINSAVVMSGNDLKTKIVAVLGL